MNPTQTTTFHAAASGAMILGLAGAAYGYTTAPRNAKADDAKHYGLLLAAIGAVAGVFLVQVPSA